MSTTVATAVPIPSELSFEGRFMWKSKPVDRCIAPLIRGLLLSGHRTSGSCCGHGRTPGAILFHDGRELLLGICQNHNDLIPVPVQT